MKTIWQIDPDDVSKVKDFFNRHYDNAFVTLHFETDEQRVSLAAISPKAGEQAGKEVAC